ncbi:MAG: Prepilin-type N-terminal cleavage/methylation domain-containing protein [Lactococcus sp.]|jgi:competence protein ComGC
MKKKSILNQVKQKQAAAFTLVEMLVVLLIISVLILLFVPNLSKQKEAVKNTGNGAIVKVVNSQAELYKLDHTDEATLSKLVSNGNITQKQADTYNEYYTKNTTETRELAN